MVQPLTKSQSSRLLTTIELSPEKCQAAAVEMIGRLQELEREYHVSVSDAMARYYDSSLDTEIRLAYEPFVVCLQAINNATQNGKTLAKA